jgi:predicted nucleic acid-binding protein
VNIVDSSGWLEYLADAPNSNFFAPPIEDTGNLIVPTISILEVFKKVCQQRGEDDALQAVALMHQGKVVDLDSALALSAAKLGLEVGLPLADSVILATARAHHATIWTQDKDFEGLEGVRFKSKKST